MPTRFEIKTLKKDSELIDEISVKATMYYIAKLPSIIEGKDQISAEFTGYPSLERNIEDLDELVMKDLRDKLKSAIIIDGEETKEIMMI